MFSCAFDADLTVLMLQGTKLLLWDSKMTVGLEMAVFQPTHCLLALLHLLPLHLPAPVNAIGWNSRAAADCLHLCR